jgi:hypothetical protein
LVRVKRVGVKDGVAVRVVVVINEILETALVLGENGKPCEPDHSRFREGGGDTHISPADYKQMFRVAAAILGKPRKKAA